MKLYICDMFLKISLCCFGVLLGFIQWNKDWKADFYCLSLRELKKKQKTFYSAASLSLFAPDFWFSH